MDEQLNFDKQLEGHLNRNARLLDDLSARGVSLDEARSVELHFWATGQANAAQLAHELYKKGYIVLCLAPAEAGHQAARWNIEAGAKLSPIQVADETLVRDLVSLSILCSGIYDGWGISV